MLACRVASAGFPALAGRRELGRVQELVDLPAWVDPAVSEECPASVDRLDLVDPAASAGRQAAARDLAARLDSAAPVASAGRQASVVFPEPASLVAVRFQEFRQPEPVGLQESVGPRAGLEEFPASARRRDSEAVPVSVASREFLRAFPQEQAILRDSVQAVSDLRLALAVQAILVRQESAEAPVWEGLERPAWEAHQAALVSARACRECRLAALGIKAALTSLAMSERLAARRPFSTSARTASTSRAPSPSRGRSARIAAFASPSLKTSTATKNMTAWAGLAGDPSLPLY